MRNQALATLRDIAETAGVSTAVVSRLLNNDASLRVSAETRERVMRVAKELEYTPNIAARSLRSAKSHLIALVVHDVTNLVYSEIIRGAQSEASVYQKALLLNDAGAGAEQLVDIIDGGGLDGIIMQTRGETTDEIIVRAAKRNVPTALLQAGPGTGAHLVSLPDAAATGLATEHLLALGHKKIGCVNTAAGLLFSEKRESGWKKSLSKAGITPTKNWLIHAQSTIVDGAKAVQTLLQRNEKFTAVVFSNAMAAIGGLHSIQKLGLRVPEDVSVITVHDIDICNYTQPPLSAVSMPLFELGVRAVQVVIEPSRFKDHRLLIDDPAPKIVVRQSAASIN